MDFGSSLALDCHYSPLFGVQERMSDRPKTVIDNGNLGPSPADLAQVDL